MLWTIISCKSTGSDVVTPLRYTQLVPRPSGSMNTWWLVFSEKRCTFSSSDGQYRGPVEAICPENTGALAKLSRMTWWIFSLVDVIQQGTCSTSSVSLRNENGLGVSSPSWRMHRP